jgi:CBS domain containing-hemolysin-like protein
MSASRSLLGWLAVGGASVALHLLAALLDRSGRIRLRHWAEEAGGGLRSLYGRPERFLAFRGLLAWMAAALPVVGLPLATAAFGSLALALAATLGLLAAAESGARLVTATLAESTLRRLTAFYRALLVATGPIVALAGLVARRARPQEATDGGEETEVSEDEIEAYLDVGAAEGILEPAEEDLVARVIDFGDTQVRSVVTPRIEMVCAPEDATAEELTGLFLESRHSRIPLYRASVDHIVGILHIRDLLAAGQASPGPPWTKLASRPLFVPDTKPLAELLPELQGRRQQMAIVVDEFGGTLGLVTLEDVLEEIVGEIADENEEEVAEREPAGDGAWRLDGSVGLDVLEELFEVDLSEEPYETVGGLIFGALGDVPRAGDRVVRHGLELVVEAVAARRARRVLVRRVAASGGGQG